MSDTPITNEQAFNQVVLWCRNESVPELKREPCSDGFLVEASVARKLELQLEETRNAAVENFRELNDRLIERQESFQAQLIRIEDTWREKLNQAQTPIYIGRPLIEILAAEGIWTSMNGNSVIAADDLFRNNPYAK